MKKPASFTLEIEVIEELKKLSKETRIPQARYVEDWIKKGIEEERKKNS